MRLRLVSNDVRRHRLISSSYISLLPCHGRGQLRRHSEMCWAFSDAASLVHRVSNGWIYSRIATWRERFRQPVRCANLFAMTFNLPASRHGMQGRTRISSVVYAPFEWPNMSHSSCNDDVTISCSYCSDGCLRGMSNTTCAL